MADIRFKLADGTVWPVPGEPVGDPWQASGAVANDIKRWASAIKAIESSGGNYKLLGPVTKSGDRAHGAYQVMGKNIPLWTKEALGRELTAEEFLNSPEAQDAVFAHRFGGYAKKYGPEGAARAWFAGEGGMNNAARKDVLGTSVPEYARRFNKEMGYGELPAIPPAGGFQSLTPLTRDTRDPLTLAAMRVTQGLSDALGVTDMVNILTGKASPAQESEAIFNAVLGVLPFGAGARKVISPIVKEVASSPATKPMMSTLEDLASSGSMGGGGGSLDQLAKMFEKNAAAAAAKPVAVNPAVLPSAATPKPGVPVQSKDDMDAVLAAIKAVLDGSPDAKFTPPAKPVSLAPVGAAAPTQKPVLSLQLPQAGHSMMPGAASPAMPATALPGVHPKLNENGQKVIINKPTAATPYDPVEWNNGKSSIYFSPHMTGVDKMDLGDIPFKSIKDINYAVAQNHSLKVAAIEPAFVDVPGKTRGAGLILMEPDGRIWLTQPTNGFGGYQATFPKGTSKKGEVLQEVALREAAEETGLTGPVKAFLGDYERDTSKARYYIAERRHGNPADMDWESQGLILVTPTEAKRLLNKDVDKKILEDVIKWQQNESSAAPQKFPGGDPHYVTDLFHELFSNPSVNVQAAKKLFNEQKPDVQKALKDLMTPDEMQVLGLKEPPAIATKSPVSAKKSEDFTFTAEPGNEKWIEVKSTDNSVTGSIAYYGGKYNAQIDGGSGLKAYNTLDEAKAHFTGEPVKPAPVVEKSTDFNGYTVQQELTIGPNWYSIKNPQGEFSGAINNYGNNDWVVTNNGKVVGNAKTLEEAKQLFAESVAGNKATAAPAKLAPANVGKLLENGEFIPNSQQGSNPGAQYRAPDGQLYYVKDTPSASHAASEKLAAALYRKAGVNTLDYFDTEKPNSVATKWVKVGHEDATHFDSGEMSKAREDYPIHVWLNNWDALGLDNSNLNMVAGKPTVMDTGGALNYRAQGGGKPLYWDAPEWENMRDPSIAPQAAAFFKHLTPKEVEAGIKKLKSVNMTEVKELINNTEGLGAQNKKNIINALIERRDRIVQKAHVFIETDKIGAQLKEINWMEYRPKRLEDEPFHPVGLENVAGKTAKEQGYNLYTPLWKGGDYNRPAEMPDPSKKDYERAFFLTDQPRIAKGYGTTREDSSLYVARAPKAVEIDYQAFNNGHQQYNGDKVHKIINAAKQRGADVVIMHNMKDVGGSNQTQYAFINTNVLRAPNAQFDPKKLHLRQPLAGLAGGGLFTYGAMKDDPKTENRKRIFE